MKKAFFESMINIKVDAEDNLPKEQIINDCVPSFYLNLPSRELGLAFEAIIFLLWPIFVFFLVRRLNVIYLFFVAIIIINLLFVVINSTECGNKMNLYLPLEQIYKKLPNFEIPLYLNISSFSDNYIIIIFFILISTTIGLGFAVIARSFFSIFNNSDYSIK